MLSLRAILIPVLLVIFASPLPLCAIALAASGENCHRQSAADPALDGRGDVSYERTDGLTAPGPLNDDFPDGDRRHDSACTCEQDRPASRSEPTVLPGFMDLPPADLLHPPVPAVRASVMAGVAPPPPLAAVSLPLLN